MIAGMTGRRDKPHRPQLTRREVEILSLIASGCTSGEMSQQLFISRATVETHRRNLLQKLDARNVAGLVRYAIENGLSDLQEP